MINFIIVWKQTIFGRGAITILDASCACHLLSVVNSLHLENQLSLFSSQQSELALISFVVIGSRMDRWSKQRQGYSLVTFTGAFEKQGLPCFPLGFEQWGHEAEANISHCATNRGSLPDKRTNQTEGKWRYRETLELWHGLSSWKTAHHCDNKILLELQPVCVESSITWNQKTPSLNLEGIL